MKVEFDEKDWKEISKEYKWCNDGTTAEPYLHYIGKSNKPKQPPLIYTDYSYLFADRPDLEILDLSDWDLSKVDNVLFMCFGDTKLKEIIGIDNWDYSNIKYADTIFSDTLINKIKHGLIKKNDLFKQFHKKEVIEKVEDEDCNILIIPMSEDDGKTVFFTDECGNEISFNPDQFSLHPLKVKFGGGYYLKYIGKDIIKPDQPKGKLTRYSFMFAGNVDLEIIDLSHWDMSIAEDLTCMFNHCSNLKEIIGIEDWDISNVIMSDCMFGDTVVINRSKISTFVNKLSHHYKSFYNECENIIDKSRTKELLKSKRNYKSTQVIDYDMNHIYPCENFCIRLEDFVGVSRYDSCNIIFGNLYLSVGDIVTIKYRFKNDYNFYDIVENNFNRFTDVTNVCKIEKIVSNDEIYVEVLSDNHYFGYHKNIVITKNDIYRGPTPSRFHLIRSINNVEDLVRVLSETKSSDTKIKINIFIYDKYITHQEFGIVRTSKSSIVLDCDTGDKIVSVKDLVESLENIDDVKVKILCELYSIKAVMIKNFRNVNNDEEVFINIILQ